MLQRQCQCLQDFEDCTAQDFCLRLLLLLCADCWQPTAGSRLLATDGFWRLNSAAAKKIRLMY